ncbi:MAG: hypothetical protein ACK559_29680, partial [bacterium]
MHHAQLRLYRRGKSRELHAALDQTQPARRTLQPQLRARGGIRVEPFECAQQRHAAERLREMETGTE